MMRIEVSRAPTSMRAWRSGRARLGAAVMRAYLPPPPPPPPNPPPPLEWIVCPSPLLLMQADERTAAGVDRQSKPPPPTNEPAQTHIAIRSIAAATTSPKPVPTLLPRLLAAARVSVTPKALATADRSWRIPV